MGRSRVAGRGGARAGGTPRRAPRTARNRILHVFPTSLRKYREVMFPLNESRRLDTTVGRAADMCLLSVWPRQHWLHESTRCTNRQRCNPIYTYLVRDTQRNRRDFGIF